VSEQENIQIVRRLFENFNRHDPDANDQFLAKEMQTQAAGATGVLDREKSRMYNRSFLDSFPDLHFDIKDVIAQGDMVACTWVARGTHKNPLLSLTGDSIPPTNRMATVPGCTVVEIRNNMVVRQDIYWDQVLFFNQLGILTEQDLAARVKR